MLYPAVSPTGLDSEVHRQEFGSTGAKPSVDVVLEWLVDLDEQKTTQEAQQQHQFNIMTK